jgi:DNA repair ATPase RecN
MIREIEVTNFQSLKHLQVKLGRFTVITGRTGAGKSGLIRALKALVFNARGTSYITRGEKQCSISMTGGSETAKHECDVDGSCDVCKVYGLCSRCGCPEHSMWQATIQRGTKDQYQLAVGIAQKTYTKLAGKVPEAVSDTLRLGEINFAAQFDKPYLLDSTGGDVARVLGKLTNVTVLFRAAQEANRRRLQVSGELKTRQADLASLVEQIQQYATLPAEQAAVEDAETRMTHLHLLYGKQERLSSLTTALELAQARLGLIRPVPEPPSLDRLAELIEQHIWISQLMRSLQQREADLVNARWREDGCVREVSDAEQELAGYVSQWGICETCGQPVQKKHAHQGEK